MNNKNIILLRPYISEYLLNLKSRFGKNPCHQYCQNFTAYSKTKIITIRWEPLMVVSAKGSWWTSYIHALFANRVNLIHFWEHVFFYVIASSLKPPANYRHCTLVRMTMKLTYRVLGHSLLRLLVRLHRWLVCLLYTARFARALCCAHSFARSLTHLHPSY